MKILVGKTFGIGNAVMAVPMIRALQTLGDVDVLIGTTPDDIGAYQVLSKVLRPHEQIYASSALQCVYDVAIMAIPFDGRWRNGADFRAKEVLDGRTRPDPSTVGLVSWEKHEAEYQMDNARQLGFKGPMPDTSFLEPTLQDPNKIYLGIGYKKDAAGFWKVKHWGNDNYVEFLKILFDRRPGVRVVTSGDFADLSMSIGPIGRRLNDSRFVCEPSYNIDHAFEIISGCGAYVGNDTGMMHVAASAGCTTLGLFFMGQKSVIKSGPLGTYTMTLESEDKVKITPELVADQLIKLMEMRHDEEKRA